MRAAMSKQDLGNRLYVGNLLHVGVKRLHFLPFWLPPEAKKLYQKKRGKGDI
jgi:hypothetical protein